MCLIQCGDYGQVGRTADAGREGGRRTVVRTSPASLSKSAGQLPVPDGAKPGAGRRPCTGSVHSRVSSARRVRAQRQVHDMAIPNRDKPGVELGARHAAPADGVVAGRADYDRCEDGDEKTLDVADKHPDIEQHLVEEARKQMIKHAIDKLPEKQRAAVLLHKYQELDYNEIAKILECSESALKSLLFRAYETLRVELAPLVAGAKS